MATTWAQDKFAEYQRAQLSGPQSAAMFVTRLIDDLRYQLHKNRRLEAQVKLLSRELQHMRRKAQHGCTDASCDICDGRR